MLAVAVIMTEASVQQGLTFPTCSSLPLCCGINSHVVKYPHEHIFSVGGTRCPRHPGASAPGEKVGPAPWGLRVRRAPKWEHPSSGSNGQREKGKARLGNLGKGPVPRARGKQWLGHGSSYRRESCSPSGMWPSEG